MEWARTEATGSSNNWQRNANSYKEKNRWREILQSVIAVIKFLSKQNLPFRGHREDSNSRNQGNFIETLKLFANYSAVIDEHIFRTQISKKGMTTYLSPAIQNELIELLGKRSHSGGDKDSKVFLNFTWQYSWRLSYRSNGFYC